MGNDNLLRHPASWPRFHPGDDLSGHDHNHFFVPSASGRYVDLSHDLGLDDPQVTRGIATISGCGRNPKPMSISLILAGIFLVSYFSLKLSVST